MPRSKRINGPESEGMSAGELGDAPRWLDCSWRRNGCGRKDCPICSRLPALSDANAAEHDSRMPNWEDVGTILAEALATIKAEVKRAKLSAKDLAAVATPPPPSEFPLYRTADRWRQDVFAIADESDDVSSAWLFTEAGEDLLWYADALAAKTYRQLTNRWHIGQGDGYGAFDLRYTGYVLTEIIGLLERSLQTLIAMDTDHKGKFTVAYLFLTGMKKEIQEI